MKNKNFKNRFYGLLFSLAGSLGLIANAVCCYYYFIENQMPQGTLRSFLNIMCVPFFRFIPKSVSLENALTNPFSLLTLVGASSATHIALLSLGIFALKQKDTGSNINTPPEIKKALENNDFEKAALLRDRLKRKKKA